MEKRRVNICQTGWGCNGECTGRGGFVDSTLQCSLLNVGFSAVAIITPPFTWQCNSAQHAVQRCTGWLTVQSPIKHLAMTGKVQSTPLI